MSKSGDENYLGLDDGLELLWNAYLRCSDDGGATLQNMTEIIYAEFDEGDKFVEEIEAEIIRFAKNNAISLEGVSPKVSPNVTGDPFETPKTKKSAGRPLSAEGAVGRSPGWEPTEPTAERFKSPSGRSKFRPKMTPKRLSFEKMSPNRSGGRRRSDSKSPRRKRSDN